MFKFWSKRSFEDPQLGRFNCVQTMWYPAGKVEDIGVAIEGDEDCPAPAALDTARGLMNQPDDWIVSAKAFVRKNELAMEFIAGYGDLVCDGFTVYKSGQFAVEFSLTEWPDAMITVPFTKGVPSGVLLGD
ncbi:hypothetical protein [Massilia sp. CF038]|uniref:hypothetical protein n=1 Tax=Massilia sp. CF038 TaxID=1881045 RepID=UPI00091F6917|nr:hypothetical protein [Massilia sp. CF038]SHH05177.1 hypothetical protein SAMN05428948_2520 [Massilia sp. CF038]